LDEVDVVHIEIDAGDELLPLERLDDIVVRAVLEELRTMSASSRPDSATMARLSFDRNLRSSSVSLNPSVSGMS
jgi:hypothetical protein